MVEVRFKPADVGTVADGSVTTVKLADGAITNAKVNAAAAIDESKLGAISQSKVTDLVTDLGNKVATGPLSGDKKITAIGWDSSTNEVIVDHEA